jgi:hypothetical protein
MAVDIEVIKFGPYPYRRAILVEVDQYVTRDRGCTRIFGKVCEVFVHARDQDEVAVRKHCDVMVGSDDCGIVVGSGESGVEAGGAHLLDDVCSQINFLE